MNPTTLKQIESLLKGSASFRVLSHIRPDGDAYGTALALAHIVRAMGKEARVHTQDGLIRSYAFLPGSDLVSVTPAEAPPADTAVLAVDTSTQERLGENFVLWQRQPDLNLDHHESNPCYGKVNLVDGESPASAQVLYDVVEALGLPCPAEAAQCLYVGLMTDTGSFRFRQTTARTFEVAAKLIRLGTDPAWAAQNCYQASSIGRFELQREVLQATKFTFGHKVAHYRLTPDLYARTGAQADEVENFLDLLQTVSTVEVAFMLEQTREEEGKPSPKVRVSLRSRGAIDVNAIAGKFGGGGHRLAAGIRSALPVDELEQSLLREIDAALRAAQADGVIAA